MTNRIGKVFSITTFGSSHGKAIGAIIDGCPANLELSVRDIQKELDKKKPGNNSVSTPRKEFDKVDILSGMFKWKTDGTPIAGIVFNENHHSKDYSDFEKTPRPSHGDFAWMMKYGNYDYAGSGRVTIGHVIGGAVAKKLLKTQNIEIISHVKQVGNIIGCENDFNNIKENVEKNPVRCGDLKAAKEMEELILAKKAEGDSVGGVVKTIACGVLVGLGEPIFRRLDGDLSRILMNIGSVKGVEIGCGFDVANHCASEINDEYEIVNDKINIKSNNSGGIIGGMSNGMPIISKIAIKPISISKCQNSIDFDSMENKKIEIKGRHDPCICPRVCIVVESSTAIVLADHMIRSGFIHPTNLDFNKSI
ncbi:chorismate synthase [Methanobrevibacter sp. V74]|uniref:chorismate synthase n=1 Tax=Methanobrevibacter sp. V74 TaxID=3064279 RepID=UPI0027372591|nr:chorismate synthase [Methanobrevibacter sp. V74]